LGSPLGSERQRKSGARQCEERTAG
jgi:hypothetical protein